MKDLSAFAAPTLDLNMGRGRVVHIDPPSAADGARLAALVTLGAAIAAGEVSDAVKAMYQEQADGLDQDTLNRLAVGAEYDRMIAENWPASDIQTVCQYATYYWTFGEATADQILDANRGEGLTPGKARRRGRNGRRTA